MSKVEYEFCVPDLENAEFFAENIETIIDSAQLNIDKNKIQIIKTYEENPEEKDERAWLVFFIKIVEDTWYVKKIPDENSPKRIIFKIWKKIKNTDFGQFLSLCLKRFLQFLPLIVTFIDGEGSEAINDSISLTANNIPGESKDERDYFDPDKDEFCSEEVKNSLHEMGIDLHDTSTC